LSEFPKSKVYEYNFVDSAVRVPEFCLAGQGRKEREERERGKRSKRGGKGRENEKGPNGSFPFKNTPKKYF
jgi:hypothetical protein